MPMTPVVSSNIDSIGYNEVVEVLVIKFKSGKVYAYRNVPKDKYEGLMNANSVGGYFNSEIKQKFPEKEIPESEISDFVLPTRPPKSSKVRLPREVVFNGFSGCASYF